MYSKDCTNFFGVYNILILLIMEWSGLSKLSQSKTHLEIYIPKCVLAMVLDFREKVIIALTG